MKRTKTFYATAVIAVLLVVNLCVTGGMMVQLSDAAVQTAQTQEDVRYTLYIGTNDKDTYTQLIPLEEAKQIVNEICVKYVGGYTVQQANGGWVDETGSLTQEETLVYSFIGVDEEVLQSIMDEVLVALNQNSILVEKANMVSSYYSGSEDNVS